MERTITVVWLATLVATELTVLFFCELLVYRNRRSTQNPASPTHKPLNLKPHTKSGALNQFRTPRAHCQPPGKCSPMYTSTLDWGDIDHPKFDQKQLSQMKSTWQRHCFSTLSHNLAYRYNDARVIDWMWSNVIKNKFQGSARSLED